MQSDAEAQTRYLSSQMGDAFLRLHNDTTRHKDLSARYSMYVQRGYMRLKQAVPTDIFEELARSLGNLLGKKIKAVENAVEFAERKAADYDWKRDLRPEDVSFVNAKQFEPDEHRLEDHPLFHQSIIKNESSVHIPTEIFSGDNEVLNGISWSRSLDDVWTENWQNDSNLLWQYFASQRGVFRMFPGMKWRKKSLDMYDCRRRQWYVQGSSSAKDVLVLLDTSGSMHGKSLRLSKAAVKKFVDTLGENDFVAVMQFPGAPSPGRGRRKRKKANRDTTPHILKDKDGHQCFKTFVQATKRNKYRIFEQINNLEAHGIANMTAALEMAFKTFHDFNAKNSPYNRGANCNGIIIILSDDAATYPKERIDELRRQYSDLSPIRIFTYAVGSDVHKTAALQLMACEHKGSYNRIPAYGAVTHIIHDVSTVLSRPMYLANEKFSVWHNIYLDSLGLGLMTSLTMPLYNRSGNYSLLGLMGTDVTVNDMEELLPLEKLGANGYAFAINLNGYIVFHPRLKGQEGWMRDPPNVDLLEVEFDSHEKREVRRKIIDSGAKGSDTAQSMLISGFIKVIDEIHVYNKTREYVYGALPPSKFGLAVVMPSEKQFYPEFPAGFPSHTLLNTDEDDNFQVLDHMLDRKVALDLFRRYGVVLSNAIDFCEEYLRRPPGPTALPAFSAAFNYSHGFPGPTPAANMSHLFTTTPPKKADDDDEEEEEIKAPKKKPQVTVPELLRTFIFNSSRCLSGARQHFQRQVLLDLVVTQLHMDWLQEEWSFVRHNASIDSIFITTGGGTTRVFPESETWRYLPFKDTRKSSEYTRAFDMEDMLLWMPLTLGRPRSEAVNATAPSLVLFKHLALTDSSHRHYQPGVTGVTMRQDFILDLFRTSSLCHPERTSRVCYLLDDAAYVMATNQPEHQRVLGHFLGYVDPVLMNYLLNISVFDRVKEYDYQASCPKETERPRSSSSSPKHIFLHAVLEVVGSALELLHRSADLLFALLSSLNPVLTVHAQEATATSNQNISCIKLGYRYYKTGRAANGEILCSDPCGRREVNVQPISGTNAVLVVASRPCEHESSCPGLSVPLRDFLKDKGPDLCEEAEKPRYRARRQYCWDLAQNLEAEQFVCSNAVSLQTRLYLFLTFLSILLGAV